MMRLETSLILLMACGPPLWPQTGELAAVVSKPISKTIDLPGELQPFLSVRLHAKVSGYVDRVLVDRGSMVKQGQLVLELNAPEVTAHIAEGNPGYRRPNRTACKPKLNWPPGRALSSV
jgi:multidrug efflux pump subunit AcrA (membrane-fusion protein)